MKKTIVLVLVLLMAIFLTVCGSNSSKAETKAESTSPVNMQTKGAEQAQQPSKPKKVLVAYYSWSGNTREIASQIQKATDGDIVEIQPAVPYPRDYDAVVKQAKEEIASSHKPALKTKINNIESYDVIFIGSPIWWGTIAPPVATFLSDYDLSGKTIVPFVTYGGSGRSQSSIDIAKLCPESTVLDGIAISGRDVKSSQDGLSKWLHEIKILK